MSQDKTHAEIRNEGLDLELIQITEEMREAMEKAREESAKNRVEESTTEGDREEEYNFREYDQRQDFFVTVSKRTFLETGHPAGVVVMKPV